jgi:hypothetical protein
MDKEKMADVTGYREVGRAGSNSESFSHSPQLLLRSYAVWDGRIVPSPAAKMKDNARL